jgi:hypothetical protein
VPLTTNFPIRPRQQGSWWTVWQNLQWFANTIFDVFQNKFQQGVATVANGNTTVTVSGIAVGTSSYQVTLTPTADPGARYWVTGKTATQFVINLSAAAGVGGVPFDWKVKAA